MTPLGLGIDVVNIARIRALSEGVRRRIFHPEELALANEMSDEVAIEYLAGRFAAKEALGKALGCGVAALVPQAVFVGRTESGKPVFILEGEAKALVGNARIELSISHDDPVAVAVVILVGGDDGAK